MAAPARFPAGVTNAAPNALFGMLPFPAPNRVHTYWNDFDTYVAGDWTVTETQAGATQALTDGDGGLLLLTNTTADNDLVALQKVGESFRFASGKPLWFAARFKVSEATQSDFVVGLQITDTTPLAVTDGVYFRKDDGDTDIDFVVIKDSTATTATAVSTVTADTFVELGFYYDGISSIAYFVDGVQKGTSATTNLPDDEDLTISFAIQNGDANARTMTVDYIGAVKAR